MRVSFIPHSTPVNPSLSLLRRALREQGITVVKPPGAGLPMLWLWQQRGQIDILHFHWIQYHYQLLGKSGSLSRLIKFAVKLLIARLLGYRIVWTLHNVLPHERAKGRLDDLARHLMARVSHQVLVYCEAGRTELQQRFGRRRDIVVTSHGGYTELGSSNMDPVAARTMLGLPLNAFVYLHFGSIRPYKQVPKLVQTFCQLPGEQLRLLLVGQIQDAAIAAQLDPLLAADKRVFAEFGYASDDRLDAFLAAADVVVLPFAEILSSGSALMALSRGRPVIVPALGCLPEWITADCGLLYDPAADAGLRQALLAAQTWDIPAVQGAALARSQLFRWDVAAKLTIEAYRNSIGK